jgi:hypothetical protein
MANFNVLAYPNGARGTRVTMKCATQVDFGTLVMLSAADTVAETAANTSVPIGVALPDEVVESENGATYYASGNPVVVGLVGAGEVVNLVNTGGVTLGTFVEPAANGAVQTLSTGQQVGVALDTATTGNRGRVLLL